jgi:hypothetical protein
LVGSSRRVELVLDAVSHGDPRPGPWPVTTSPTRPALEPGKFGRRALDSVFVKSYMRNIRSRGCAEVFHLKWGNGQAEPFLFLRYCNCWG